MLSGSQANNYRIFAIGELLKDVHFKDISREELEKIQISDLNSLQIMGKIRKADDAGAPAIVAAYTSLLGGKSRLLANIGNDIFGDEIRRSLQSFNIELILPKNQGHFTDCAIIHYAGGQHEFIKFFWDSMQRINENDINEDIISDSDILHIGSVAPCAFQESRKAVYRAIDIAKKHGRVISFDLNLRNGIYTSIKERFIQAANLMGKSDISKMTASELMFMAGFNGFSCNNIDIEKLIYIGNEISRQYRSKLMLVTLGGLGALAYSGERFVWRSAYDFGKTINTIGAGDAFMAASLKKSIEHKSLDNIYANGLQDILDFGCRIAGISVTIDSSIVAEVMNYENMTGRLKYKDFGRFKDASKEILEKEAVSYMKLRSYI